MDCLARKKEEQKSCCLRKQLHPGNNGKSRNRKTTAGVKVLGSGCAKCHALEEAARAALEELNMDTTIEHVTDFSQIAAYGVMTTPALVVDGKVVSYGKVLKKMKPKRLFGKFVKAYERKAKGSLHLCPLLVEVKLPRLLENIWLRCL